MRSLPPPKRSREVTGHSAEEGCVMIWWGCHAQPKRLSCCDTNTMHFPAPLLFSLRTHAQCLSPRRSKITCRHLGGAKIGRFCSSHHSLMQPDCLGIAVWPRSTSTLSTSIGMVRFAKRSLRRMKSANILLAGRGALRTQRQRRPHKTASRRHAISKMIPLPNQPSNAAACI